MSRVLAGVSGIRRGVALSAGLVMAGGLAVILALQALGWFALPAGIIIYLFELGLVATLQAFIFATLAAIYIGGAATHH